MITAKTTAHLVIACKIPTKDTIMIDTMIAMIVTITITMFAINHMIATIAILAIIATTRITRAIAITVTRMERTINVIAIKRTILNIDWAVSAKRIIMPCMSMLIID